MDRAEAIRELTQWRDQMKSHGVPNYGKKLTALDLAIEALKQTEIVRCRDCKHYNPPHIGYNDGTRKDYPDGFVTADIGVNVGGKCENSTTTMRTYCLAHDRENPDDFEELVIYRQPMEYCSFGEKAEKHQLSGETSTISKKHQLMLPLDDAVKVVGRICDEWWTLEDGDIEFIRNELEQKCYRIDQTTDCNDCIWNTCNYNKIDWEVSEDCTSRQALIDEVLEDGNGAVLSYTKGMDEDELVERIEKQMIKHFIGVIEYAPPVTPTEQQEHGRLIDADKLLQELFTIDEEEWTTPEIRAILENAPTVITPTERTGEWIEIPHSDFWKCSCCGDIDFPRDFCPNCGAKMKGGTE